MTLIEFGKASTHKLWKYVSTDWEGDTYECPKWRAEQKGGAENG